MATPDDIRRQLESIADRVSKNETDYGDALRQIASGQGQIDQITARIGQISDRVGTPPTQDTEGTGMAKDLAELKATVGRAPNHATGSEGSGMAATLADVRVFVEEAKELAEKQASKPVEILRKVQTISAVVGTLVLVGTIFSGCGGILVWLFRRLPYMFGQ